jgi:hypothetical protein
MAEEMIASKTTQADAKIIEFDLSRQAFGSSDDDATRVRKRMP